MPPDDFAALSKPFHHLVDAITECMITEMGKVKRRYVAAIKVHEKEGSEYKAATG